MNVKGIIWFILPVGILAAFLLLPTPIDSQAFSPQPAPKMEGTWAPNNRLTQTSLLAKNQIQGPEDVDMDDQGRIYGGQKDGKIFRINESGTSEVFADTQGRPLGLEFDPQGNLIVADAMEGLLSITPEGKITTLATETDGIPYGFTDDLDIARDGTIYFSDASTRWNVHDFRNDALELKPTGRLITYNPKTGHTRTLLSGLFFANGIALSKDEDFVLVNETWKYRITRYWLKGPKAGTHDIFIDNLPGFPDGISSNKQGNFWLALYSPRNPLLDSIHPHPWIKEQMAKLPTFLLPKPVRFGLIAKLDQQGQVLASYQDPNGETVSAITSVEQAGDTLLLGTLTGQWIGKIPLDQLK